MPRGIETMRIADGKATLVRRAFDTFLEDAPDGTSRLKTPLAFAAVSLLDQVDDADLERFFDRLVEAAARKELAETTRREDVRTGEPARDDGAKRPPTRGH